MNDIKIDKIIRSRRKTIALVITQDASLVVRAPFKTSLDYINKIANKKRLWIKKKQEFLREKYQKLSHKEYVNGEGFLYLGETYKLEIVKDLKCPVVLENTLKISEKLLPNAKQHLMDWYRKQAFIKISDRIEWYAKIAGFTYKSIKITDAKKRWGSCSSKGNLNFSWRLIMAPLKVVDYVVVHELAHLEEKNHSKRFWNKIRIMLPGYQESKEWIKYNGHLLVL